MNKRQHHPIVTLIEFKILEKKRPVLNFKRFSIYPVSSSADSNNFADASKVIYIELSGSPFIRYTTETIKVYEKSYLYPIPICSNYY